MRIRKKKWAQPELSACRFYVPDPQRYRGRWRDFFSNGNPIVLEVGCGKCAFVSQMALKHPGLNFIAVDIKLDMLGVGRRCIVNMFSKNNREVDNIALVCFNVEMLEQIISAEDKIQRIYINFCNPWPKKKHKKRRLTFPNKLRMYRRIMEEGREIHFKTDDDELFRESLEYFADEGFELVNVTYDLHNSGIDPADTPATEHERMFSEQGINIKYCVARIC